MAVHPDRKRWDARYESKPPVDVPTPPAWLHESLELIRALGGRPGRALDIACGDGRAAIELARRGWEVDAFDVSLEALKRLKECAERLNVRVRFFLADATRYPLPSGRYDLITVFNFLDRKHLPYAIPAALKPGGFLAYETYTTDALEHPGFRVSNPDFLLQPNELFSLYASRLRVLRFRDQGLEGRPAQALLAVRQG